MMIIGNKSVFSCSSHDGPGVIHREMENLSPYSARYIF